MLSFVAAPAAAAVVSSAPRVSFVPSAARVGALVVPAEAFRAVGEGVLSSFGWDAARSGIWVVVGGRRFLCLVKAVGGFGSPGAVALAGAVRAARASGRVVSLVGAPGARGRVAVGYFCGLAAL